MQGEHDSSYYSDDHFVTPPVNSRPGIGFPACVNPDFTGPSPDSRFEVFENNLCLVYDVRCSSQVYDILPPGGDTYDFQGLVSMDLSVLGLHSTSMTLIGFVKPAILWCEHDVPHVPQEVLVAIHSMLNLR
jgi:hypothetical protein